MNDGHIPAAQYLRMSTDQQQYSLQNQERQNLKFAQENGYTIVQTYSDPGRSGLHVSGRRGLGCLISDVLREKARYKAILVYDISRWGRFQDIDEAAHYEFLCRSHGVEVQYSAEPFKNDGSIYSEILKGLKRVMAAEYSRKLGVDVYRGQKRLAELGYKMGGVCGFGLRRLVVSATGARGRMLANGQQKAIKSDHVIQIAGPASEQKLVRRIYKMALTTPSAKILQELNQEGIKYNDGRPWTLNRINGVLTNIKYTGCNVWGRVSVKLSGKKIYQPKEQWIIGPPTFQAIVSRKLYDEVQAARRSRYAPAWSISDDLLLEDAARALRKHGNLSTKILQQEHISPTLLYTRFGGVSSLYEKLGYRCRPFLQKAIERCSLTVKMRKDVIAQITELQPSRVKIAKQSPKKCVRETLLIDDEILLTVQTTLCKRTKSGLRWMLLPRNGDYGKAALICKTDAEDKQIEEFYVATNIKRPGPFVFRNDDPWLLATTRVTTLCDVPDVVKRLRAELRDQNR